MEKLLIQIGVLFLIAIASVHVAVIHCSNPTGPCNVVNITDVTSENEKITVSGRSADFLDPTVSSLAFYGPIKIIYVPSLALDIFPNVQSITISNASLTNLVSNAFRNCSLLMTIAITENNFKHLAASIAPTCINVTSLQLTRNNIETVDTDALKGMTFLNYIMLRDNQISCIPPSFFRHTPVLQNIDLYGNLITKLDPMTFVQLPNLNSIMLGNNKIVSIPVFNLTHTAMTMGLNIMFDNNEIKGIHPQFLTSLFSQRSGYISSTMVNFFDTYGNLTTCFTKDNMYTSSISNYNWPIANIYLDKCYQNWNSEYETPVSCTPILSTTPSILTTTRFDGNESNEDVHQWLKRKDFFAIISNAMRNFTANVQFF